MSSIGFSIDSEEATPFSALDYTAFDLGHDPEMKLQIRPVLIGAESISKKVLVTFLEPLQENQPFGVMLRCTLPRSIKTGFGYCTSTFSIGQATVPRGTVRLIFVGPAPQWLRVYESTAKQPNKLVKTLAPTVQEPGLCEYVDVVDGRPGQSARVYAFSREG
ncbi:hypothetical protein [Granulicella aggregans]|uniref:hypothetical protein n=1 Tax=Granulicella aggregans TaxID=474949 RepID=UPI0021DF6B61|nr:hypothetical protein [Granulicella aggregans]